MGYTKLRALPVSRIMIGLHFSTSSQGLMKEFSGNWVKDIIRCKGTPWRKLKMIEKNLWLDITLLKQAAMIFSSAFNALVSCVTRFNGEAGKI